ncbi:MAG: conjugal transfer protein TrbL family protein [Bacillota bacterium]
MKRIYKVFYALPVVLASVFFILPNQTHAFGLGDILTDMVVTPLREGVTALVQQGLVGITQFVTDPTDLSKYTFVDQSIEYAKYLAVSLLVLNVLKEIIKSMIEEGYGSGGKPIDLIAGQAIKSVAFIYGSQWILQDCMIRLNNSLIPVVTSITPAFHTYSETDAVRQSNELVRVFVGTADSAGIIVMMLCFLIILGIGFIVLVIVAGFRQAQIAFLLVIGPILAVSAVDKGEAFNTWIRESAAVVFTQLLQIWLFGFLLNLLLSGGFWDIIYSIGVVSLMIMGPSVIKPYVHSSGAGGAAIGAARAGAYRFMMRGVMKG